eukprot:2527785-Amphidinium_carterae.2
MKKKRSKEKPGAIAASKEKPAEPNPYDIFQNKRRRHQVLGEKVKGAKRNLSKARANSASERVRTLLAESLKDRRTSQFKDAR